jgi:hypothetical protein
MKILLGAAVAAFLTATPAMAQTTPAPASGSSCAAIAASPTLPDGATATHEQMELANTAFQTWFQANRTALECRRAEVETARTRYEALRTEFNSGAEQLNTVNTTWQADVAEFNERNPRSRTR